MPFRSVIAIDGRHFSTAVSMSVSGREAPSRKLKALAACSSTYSVIEGGHAPFGVHDVMHDAAEDPVLVRGLRNHIPLLNRPCFPTPPIAAQLPRAPGAF